jgi:threonine/homoserine/homoserine lactone efflux protein
MSSTWPWSPRPGPSYAGHVPAASDLLVFALTAFILIVVPGPSVLFTVGRALTVGRRGALLTVVGNAAGVYVQVLAVAVGLGAIIEASALVYTVLKFAGAAYLVYLGVQAIRHRRWLWAGHGAVVAPTQTRRVLREGFVVGVTNPKMIVFLVAALPQFVDRGAGQVPLQMLFLGVVVALIAVVSDSVWAFAAGTARLWFARSPRRTEAFAAAGGVAMIGVGVALAATGEEHKG